MSRTIALLAILAGALPLNCHSDSLSTAQIVDRSVSTDCLEWKIVGACIWLRCSILGCRVVTTPKISHRLPDFVVAAYPHTGDSPWSDRAQQMVSSRSSLEASLSGGGITGVGASHLLQDDLKFYEVDIDGSPVTQLPNVARYLCKRATQPLFTYYSTVRDATAWRSGLPDANRREARQPGVREIGYWPDFSWGSIYPRSGFIMQTHAGKAAAVASQRAIDIVLRDSSGHITEPFNLKRETRAIRGNPTARSPSECQRSGGKWQREPPFNEQASCVRQEWHQWLPVENERTDRWQMLLPHHSRRCETFGRRPEWPHPSISKSGRYIWNYWARYKCCVKAGGVLLKHFDF